MRTATEVYTSLDKVDRQLALLYEQQALKKLRAIKPKSRIRIWSSLWRWIKILPGLFARAELVRNVGPGLPPLPRHEWESRDPRTLFKI